MNGLLKTFLATDGSMENSEFDDYIVGTACPKCGEEFERTMAWCRAHDAIECPCGGRIQIRYESLIRMLTPGTKGMDGMRGVLEAIRKEELKEIKEELRNYARDHPELSDQELQRHVYEAQTNRFGEYLTISIGGASIESFFVKGE